MRLQSKISVIVERWDSYWWFLFRWASWIVLCWDSHVPLLSEWSVGMWLFVDHSKNLATCQSTANKPSSISRGDLHTFPSHSSFSQGSLSQQFFIFYFFFGFPQKSSSDFHVFYSCYSWCMHLVFLFFNSLPFFTCYCILIFFSLSFFPLFFKTCILIVS